MLKNIDKQSESQSWRRKGRQWWFAAEEGFKPGMKEWGWWNTSSNKYKSYFGVRDIWRVGQLRTGEVG